MDKPDLTRFDRKSVVVEMPGYRLEWIPGTKEVRIQNEADKIVEVGEVVRMLIILVHNQSVEINELGRQLIEKPKIV